MMKVYIIQFIKVFETNLAKKWLANKTGWRKYTIFYLKLRK